MISEIYGGHLIVNCPYHVLKFFSELFLTDWMGDFSVQVEGESTGSPSDLTLDDFTFENCGPPEVTAVCPEYHIQCPDTGQFTLPVIQLIF